MGVRAHTQPRTCIHMHKCVHTHTDADTQTHKLTYAHTHTHTPVNTHENTKIHMPHPATPPTFTSPLPLLSLPHTGARSARSSTAG